MLHLRNKTPRCGGQGCFGHAARGKDAVLSYANPGLPLAKLGYDCFKGGHKKRPNKRRLGWDGIGLDICK